LVGVLEGAGVGRWLSRLGALGDLTDLGVHLGAVAFALSRQLLPHPEGLRERLLAAGVLTLEDLPTGLLTDSGQLELDASGEGLLLLQTECPDLAGLGSGDDSVRELRRKVTLEPLEEFPHLLRYVFALDRAHHMSVGSIPLAQDSQRIQLFFVPLTFHPSGAGRAPPSAVLRPSRLRPAPTPRRPSTRGRPPPSSCRPGPGRPESCLFETAARSRWRRLRRRDRRHSRITDHACCCRCP